MRRQRRAVWRELFDALPDLALLGRILVASAVFGDDRISLFAVNQRVDRGTSGVAQGLPELAQMRAHARRQGPAD